MTKSGAAASKTETIKPSFCYYNTMTFLNDTLQHRQTVISLRKIIDDSKASTSKVSSNTEMSQMKCFSAITMNWRTVQYQSLHFVLQKLTRNFKEKKKEETRKAWTTLRKSL